MLLRLPIPVSCLSQSWQNSVISLTASITSSPTFLISSIDYEGGEQSLLWLNLSSLPRYLVKALLVVKVKDPANSELSLVFPTDSQYICFCCLSVLLCQLITSASLFTQASKTQDKGQMAQLQRQVLTSCHVHWWHLCAETWCSWWKNSGSGSDQKWSDRVWFLNLVEYVGKSAI